MKEKHQGFRYDFTPRELKYFMFGKNKCPKCGASMKREKKWETGTGKEYNSKADAFFAPQLKVKHYFYEYECEQCHSTYTLSELAEKGR